MEDPTVSYDDTTDPSAHAGGPVDAEVVDATDVTEPPAPAPPAAAAPPPAPAPPVSTDLIARPTGTTELIQAKTAEERVQKASEVASALDAVIRAQGMRTKVGSLKKIDPATGDPVRVDGREVWVPRWHVNVEGWQTLATLLGLAVVPLEPTVVRDPITGEPERVAFDVHEKSYYSKAQGGGLKAERTYQVTGYSWQCRTEVFKDGGLIAAATSVCSRTEERWKDADDYAVMGMAQTRSTGRAIAQAARWIVTLAGYQATPAEEMPADAGRQGPTETAQEAPRFGPALEDAHKAALLEVVVRLMRPLQMGQATPEETSAARATAKAIVAALGYMPKAAARALQLVDEAKTEYVRQLFGGDPVAMVERAQALAQEVLDANADEKNAGPPPEQRVQQPAGVPANAPADVRAALADARTRSAPPQTEEQIRSQAWLDQASNEPRPAPGSVTVALSDRSDPDRCAVEWRAAGCTCDDPLDVRKRDAACPIDGHAIVL